MTQDELAKKLEWDMQKLCNFANQRKWSTQYFAILCSAFLGMAQEAREEQTKIVVTDGAQDGNAAGNTEAAATNSAE